jgi:PAS domain S-box-containing protein
MVDNGHSTACILIVDDVPDTLDLLSDWLELHSFQTIRAMTGADAIEMAIDHQPDLILMDVMMPHMDGIETCRLLKARPQTASIPVILVTARDPGDARAEGLIAGAVDYVTKPINLQDLTQRVESALAARRETPVDTQRLLEEVTHTTLAIMNIPFVWMLGIEQATNSLISQALVTSSGTQDELRFQQLASDASGTLRYPVDESANPLCAALVTRNTATNYPARNLMEMPSTQRLYEGMSFLGLTHFTVVPLIAAGKTAGVMVLGSHQAIDMESPRAQQILVSLASQAAIALDYLRLITDIQHREQERQAEQTFRNMILDTMSDALVVIDGHGTIQYVNRRMQLISGYRPDYLINRSVAELFHPDDRNEVVEGLLRENASTMKFDQRLLTRSGQVIPVLLSRSRTQSKTITSQVIVLSDMTEQKKREIALEQQALALEAQATALERQTRQLTALNKASQAITSNLSLHQTLQAILDSATRVVEAQGASLFMVNRENNTELVVVAAVGHRAEEMIGLRLPIGEGLAGWVAREGRSELVTNLQEDPRFYRGVDEKTGMRTRSLIAVPMIHAEYMIGVIEVINKLNNAIFDADDVNLLESMASTAAVSIVNTQLYDQSQRRVIELATLLGASEAASSTLELAGVFEQITHSMTLNLEVARTIILSWNDKKRQLETLAEVADAYWADGPVRLLDESSAAWKALTTGQPTIVSGGTGHLSIVDRSELASSAMTSLIALPLWLQGSTGGLAILYTDRRSGYTAEDVTTARNIVTHWQNTLADVKDLSILDQTAISVLAERLQQTPDTRWVTIQNWQPGADHTRVMREIGFTEWTHRVGPCLNIDDHPAIDMVLNSKSSTMSTLSMLAPTSPERIWLEYHGGQSYLIVPLITHGTVSGIIILMDNNERIFLDEEVNLAQGIANVVSNAIENARLYQSLQSRAKALEGAYDDLKRADRAKDHFIQNVSHEIRTPLIHVLGYAELLTDGTFGETTPEQQEALQFISQKGQKIADIVEDMVALQAQETVRINREPVDLRAVVRQALKKYQSIIQEVGLQVVTQIPSDIPPVSADTTLITQAIDKLLENAIKFGAEGKRLEIILRDTDGPMVQLAIRDFGIGIDPAEQTHIFQRFYQVDGGVNRRFGGTGLGLSVAKTIIEAHGGRIGVKSRLNEGSVFFFTLPKHTIVAGNSHDA